MSIAKNVSMIIDGIERDEQGFQVEDWKHVRAIVSKFNPTDAKECRCGSNYCSVCKGSYDPNYYYSFEDGSSLEVSNPLQGAFSRETYAV